jgi:hypothetical protein
VTVADADGELLECARRLAYVTETVDQELLLRNEYLAAENRIPWAYGPIVHTFALG